MAKIAYVRVSSQDQNLERQIEAMRVFGIEEKNIFQEKESGKNISDRPVLIRVMEYVRDGDTLVVESISRLARNTRDLLDIVERLTSKGVEFVSLKEMIDTTTAPGKFMLTIFAAVSQLERDYLRQRQAEGIEIAKQKGVYKGRKKIEPNKKEFTKIYGQWKDGNITAVTAMKLLGLTRNTFYRRVAEYEESLV